EERNIQKLRAHLQEQLDTRPGEFMEKIVMPMTPNSMLEDKDGDQTPEDKAALIRAAAAAMDSTVGGAAGGTMGGTMGGSGSGSGEAPKDPPVDASTEGRPA